MALILPFEGKLPKVAADAFLAPTAVLVGDVDVIANMRVLEPDFGDCSFDCARLVLKEFCRE